MKNLNLEIAKIAIVNEQLGNPVKLQIANDLLSDKDKEQIKQAVIENAGKGLGLTPDELAQSLIQALKRINLA